MRIVRTTVTAASAVAVLLGSMLVTMAVPTTASAASDVEEGKSIAFNRKKGNCLACHAVGADGGNLPGNIGPPLINMKDRYPDKAKLAEQIYDATKNNPNTIMPPFGRHEILSKDELAKVVEFIYTQ